MMSSHKELNPLIYTGPIVHSLSLQELKIISDGVVAVNAGKIVYLEESSKNLQEIQRRYGVSNENVHKLGKGQFLAPGLIDTHIHAPQYPNIGLGYDLPLLEWLRKYTFPLEEKYSDEAFAEKVYKSVVKKTLHSGTTTSCYYATVHANSSVILAKCAIEAGQRAFVGKVNMNINPSSTYVEKGDWHADTKTFIEQVLAFNNRLVQPVITPRFALSCDREMMRKLGELAKQYNIPIQTHVSENQTEVKLVKEQFPESINYVDVYDNAGLLSNKTVLAHGVYLTPEELKIVKEKGTTIVHCPNSNTMLQSGLCPVRNFLDLGVKVSLGTDCAGGYSPSMLKSMREAVQCSIQASFNGLGKKLTLAEVFYMSTLAGAEALSLGDVTGNFTVGKDFDAIVVTLGNGAVDLLEDYNIEQLFQKWIYLGDDRSVTRVYVGGRLVKDM